MISKLKKLFIFTTLPLLIICIGGGQVSAFDLFGNTCNGNNVNGGNKTSSPICTSNNNNQGSDSHHNVVLKTINDIINIVAVIAGAVAVIMIMVAGFTYVTAGGNAEDTKKARGRIIYAAVGLAIIATSWTITSFILDKILS